MTRDPWTAKPRPVKTVLAVAGVVVAGFLLLPGSGAPSQGARETMPATTTPPSATVTPSTPATPDPALEEVAAAAIAGVGAWQTLDPATRTAALRQTATPEFTRLVADTPAADLPTAPPVDTYDTTIDDETPEAHTTVALQDGARLLVTLDGSTGRWLVDDIQEA